MSQMTLRTSSSRSIQARVVISPATIGNAGLDEGFAGHAGAGIAREQRVQHRVGNLVRDLVRMAFGDRFGRKEVTCAHSDRLPVVENGEL